MTNREAFATAMAVLGNTYDRKLTPPAMEGYWIALGDLAEDEFARATQVALQRSKFMPTPAELRDFARPPRPIEARSAAAWIAVRDAIRKHDYTVASIDFGPLTNTVLRAMGSWEWLCELGDEAMKWEAKRFVELFAAFASGSAAALRAEPLDGWGVGRVGCARVAVPIEGEAAPARLALPSAGGGALAGVVRELADAKSQAGAREQPLAGPGPASQREGRPAAPRETKEREAESEQRARAAIAELEARVNAQRAAEAAPAVEPAP